VNKVTIQQYQISLSIMLPPFFPTHKRQVLER